MSITGYSCGDLFFQPRLRRRPWTACAALRKPRKAQAPLPWRACPSCMKMPCTTRRRSSVRQSAGTGPQTVLPNYREFTAAVYLRQGAGNRDEGGQSQWGIYSVRNGNHLPRRPPPSASAWKYAKTCGVIPQLRTGLLGARAILNPSAGTELTGKAAYRRELVRQQSGRCLCAYVLSSAGVHESTTDTVFGGHSLIADNGRPAAEGERFCRESTLIFADVDFERLEAARLSESSFNDSKSLFPAGNALHLALPEQVPGAPGLEYAFNPARPFLPSPSRRRERCEEIISIQTAGLAKRMEHTRAQRLVIGISGGLDSTLALLICSRACRALKRPASDILAVTMPGFGTTDRTHDNAVTMCRLLGVELREIPISECCLRHFADIGHDPAERTTTYENVQARERTQILMDLANKTGGLVVGTGDLSEIALGWSTYNGDHMSMYAVNCSIPKTLIRCLIEHIAGESSPELAATLADINNTPVSPELLPPSGDGSIEQRTEDVLGPYDLHDFFLFHFIKYGAEPDKILYLAEHAFRGEFQPDFIRRRLGIFIRRFFRQRIQARRMPDGPKVGTIALSPRGDWRMPSDACGTVWEKDISTVEPFRRVAR
ncbi:MAG: NAD(+) synthase [Akkermansia sp.]